MNYLHFLQERIPITGFGSMEFHKIPLKMS